jgi:predicted dehydrogenase
MTTDPVTQIYAAPARPSFEWPRRLRVGLVGCGGQALRNLLPALSWSPAEVVATCDVLPERARAYAGHAGAHRWYGDYEKLLADDEVEAVLLCTGYLPDGSPRYPDQAVAAVEAGKHAWVEKPPAARTADIERMAAAASAHDRQIGVGLMKMFSTVATTVREVMGRPEFGAPTTVTLRDPEMLPTRADMADLSKLTYLLDHLVHPVSLLHRLFGPVRRLAVERAPNGGAVFLMSFASGPVGSLHMPWGQGGTSPMERLEVVGEGANVVAEAGVRITYYRPGHRGAGLPYGQGADYTTSAEEAPLRWDLDGYSGQPYNMNHFYQGYTPELIHFAQSIVDGRPVAVGHLGDAWHVVRFFEACRQLEDGFLELDRVADPARCPQPAPVLVGPA